MNYLLDSIESEALKKMIDDKKKFYHKQVAAGNTRAAQFLQDEIMFLENDILPLVLQNSNIAHWEIAKYIIRAFEAAVKFDCNGLLTYIPIKADYTDNPIIGIVNPKQYSPFRTPEAMQIWVNEIEFINMDGNGAEPKPINLTLNDLM